MELLKQIRLQEKKNILTKSLFEKNFYDNYRSVIVLANPKTVPYDRKADESIKSMVIRADTLISYIKQVNNQGNPADNSDSKIKELAKYYQSVHIERDLDYAAQQQGVLRDDA